MRPGQDHLEYLAALEVVVVDVETGPDEILPRDTFPVDAHRP